MHEHASDVQHGGKDAIVTLIDALIGKIETGIIGAARV